MRKILLVFLLFWCQGCFDNSKESDRKIDLISSNLLNSKMSDIMSAFIEENPKSAMWGLFFIKYHQDTCKYIFISLPANKQEIYKNKPDTVLKLKNKYVLVNFGFNNLTEYDSVRFNKIIRSMEADNFVFEKDAPATFSPVGFLIKAKNGRFSTDTKGLNILDVPTSNVKLDTSGGPEYIPSLEELRNMPDSF